jgi:hypothetical protein
VKKKEIGNNLSWALQSLPLFDDVFLSMQALNLGMVHEFLIQIERDLLRDLIELEHTPPNTIFVSALSQLWVFGLYELLRTWRQRAREVLTFGDKVARETGPVRKKMMAAKKSELRSSASEPLSILYRWSQFRKVVTSPRYSQSVRHAIDRYEVLFRRLEALRVSLAKHEIPQARGIPALAPGYARIDARSGSMYWQVLLQGMEVDTLTRRDVADHCLSLATDLGRPILMPEIQAKILSFSRKTWFCYGIHKLAAKLKDGREFKGVYVAWSKEIVRVEGQKRLPFDPKDIVDVRLC